MTITHADGTIQTQQIDGPLIARDSRGRIYREIRGRVTDNSDPQSGLEYIVILDPIAHRRTECAITERTCAVLSYRERPSVNPPPADSLDNDYEFVPRQNLGIGLVGDLNVTGTRQTILGNADREGRPRLIEQEFWYSPDLEMNLIVAKKYSNGNSLVIHVLDISRAEPDPSLFQVPDGFAVQD